MALGPDALFPTMLLPRVGGGSVRLPTGPGLLFFFRVDCGASASAALAVSRIADHLLVKGLAVVAISQDDAGDTAAFAAQHGLGAVELAMDLPSFPASMAAEIGTVPASFLVNDGRVVAVVEGWARRDYNAMAAMAAQLVGSEAPTASPASDGLPDMEPGITARNAS